MCIYVYCSNITRDTVYALKLHTNHSHLMNKLCITTDKYNIYTSILLYNTGKPTTVINNFYNSTVSTTDMAYMC